MGFGLGGVRRLAIAINKTMNDKDKEKELIRRAMSILGSRKSPRKAQASRVNGAKGGKVRWENHKKRL